MGEGKRGEGREKNLTASSFSLLSTVQFSQGCIYLYEQQKKKHNLKKKKNKLTAIPSYIKTEFLNLLVVVPTTTWRKKRVQMRVYT